MLHKKHVAFPGRLVIVGFGSIGQGVLPLLLRHLDIAAERITIITAEPRGHDVAAEYGIRFIETALTRSNYRALLEPQLGEGDFLLNVSVDVSSVALIELCQERGALYLDTCIEPWPGGYTDPSLPPSARSNYALRESALAVRARYSRGPTAVLTHGANPGLVSHFVKQALIDLASGAGLSDAVPATRAEWARLAEGLGAGVEIEGTLFLAQLDQCDTRHVDRDIEQKVAATQPGFEHRAIVFPRQRRFDERYAVLGGNFIAARLGGDDGDLPRVDHEMAQQQRQDALPNAAKANHHKTAEEGNVLLVHH